MIESQWATTHPGARLQNNKRVQHLNSDFYKVSIFFESTPLLRTDDVFSLLTLLFFFNNKNHIQLVNLLGRDILTSDARTVEAPEAILIRPALAMTDICLDGNRQLGVSRLDSHEQCWKAVQFGKSRHYFNALHELALCMR